NRPTDPDRRHRSEVLLPRLFVVRKHEMLRYTGSEGAQNPVMEILRSAVRSGLHAIYKTNDALLYHFRRKTICICLEGIRSDRRFGINRCAALMRVEHIRENPWD